MGACASKFGVFKGTADAAPPEVGSRDVNLAENIDNKDGKSEVPAGDESNRQLLGNLLKENEGKDDTVEGGGKLSEVVKLEDVPKDISLENENVKSSEPVCDAPAKAADTVVESLIPDESKAGDGSLVKLSEETVAAKTALEKEAAEEQAELPKFETTLMDKHEECKPALETGKDLAEAVDKDKHGEGKPDNLVEATNLETPDCEKIEDQQPDPVVEKVMVEISALEERSPEVPGTEKQAEKEGDKEPAEHPNTDKCGDTPEVKTSL